MAQQDDDTARSSTGRRVPALLAPREVAALFGVDPKTVTRWAKSGKLTCIHTPGGHRRFPRSEVNALLARLPGQRDTDDATG